MLDVGIRPGEAARVPQHVRVSLETKFRRDLKFARGWLFRHMRGDPAKALA